MIKRNALISNPTGDKLNDIADFFCWIFSKSSNLLDILTTEKSGFKLDVTKTELLKYDVTFNIVINWKLMKEFYNGLTKMPQNIINLTMTSISFCIANDIKYKICNILIFKQFNIHNYF